MCPISAALVWLRYTRPLSTRPPPTPVPTVSMTRFSTTIRPPSDASASAAQDASLST